MTQLDREIRLTAYALGELDPDEALVLQPLS